jgi:hypothetical protein
MHQVLDNTKLYEDIANKRSSTYSDIERALEIVRSFIIEKKLIVYGGMAIDIALKKAGHEGIYKEDAIPDYDFMSPNFYEDSNELAVILHKSGFNNVGAINGAHLTTRRVRVNFNPVGDLSYIPKEIYDKVPTIEHKRMRFVHPNFQRMDLHHAFNFPYENPPMEVMLHRIKKDLQRFKLLDEYYPIEQDQPTGIKKQTIELPKKLFDAAVLGGVEAYAVIYQKFIDTIKSKKIKIPPKDMENIAVASFAIGSDNFKFETPTINNPINILTDDFKSFIDKLKTNNNGIKYYNRFLDNLRPRMLTIRTNVKEMPTYEIFDIKGSLLPIYKVDSITIVQPQYLLMYFLQKSFEATMQAPSGPDEKISNFYNWLYASLMSIIDMADELNLEGFSLSAETYGQYNWSATYIYSVRDRYSIIKGISMKDRPVQRPPMGYFPSSSSTPEPFNPSDSEFFAIDGKECESFEPLNLIPKE